MVERMKFLTALLACLCVPWTVSCAGPFEIGSGHSPWLPMTPRMDTAPSTTTNKAAFPSLAEDFAASNMENVLQELARGGGEYVASLATMMAIPADRQAGFFAAAQTRYAALTRSGAPTPEALLEALTAARGGLPVTAEQAPRQ
jgi:hypothetical protein